MSAKGIDLPKTTLRDVARRAQVGVGTVSRVLNAEPNVSEATRKRVLATIEELGYQPDMAAKALRSRRTGAIGALVPFFTKHFYVEVLRAVVRAAAIAGLSLIVFDIERDEEREFMIWQGKARGLVDGLLVVSLVPTEKEIQAIASSGLKLVLIDSSHPGLSTVEIDHEHGGFLAASHLTDLRHRRIALIDRPEDPFASKGFSRRLDGYRRALGEANLAVDQALLTTGDYSRQSGRELMRQLLQLQERPTAVFAGSDLQAIGAMEAIREAGLQVPGDIALVGYNDIELAEYIGLTTVRLPTTTIGDEGVRLLKECLAGGQTKPTHVQVRGELIVRQSSGEPITNRPEG